MNKYTNIGEAVITSTVTGKAQIRVVQKHHLRSGFFLLLAVIILGAVAIAWLGRNKQPATANVSATHGAEHETAKASVVHPAPQPEKSAHVQAEQAAKPVEQPQASPLNPQQQANNEFHKAQQLVQQGKPNEAIESYRATLLLDAGNDAARQAMVDLLLKGKRTADAERALQIGLKNNPKDSSYSMQLARLLTQKNELPLALEVMQRTLPYAAEQADYQAFYASLLQRQSRHDEAITYYQKALGLKPGSGEWLMGMGISLKAVGRTDEAADAFKHALETHTLTAQSQAFVEQQVTPSVANPQ